ncbi:MAG: redox-sensing transcriptional repressor Rex [Bacteroidaceae bacterium]|nr:redox-sensing transcriptional repressor Rex [Bacteroidaceae bacterium]MBR5812922.1 redox-sensing transcriptional repressor Rex [Bacteroidaceae bacterium]
MTENTKIEKVPEPTLRRLPWYLSVCRLLKQRGEQHVSSTRLSKETNIVASQIAKDLSCVNIIGRTRVGYDIDNLLEVLEDFLGFTRIHKAFLFGAGRLGSALLNDSGLKQFGLEVVAAFDTNPKVVGHSVAGIPVYHINDLEAKIKRYNVKIGILTVPIDRAQEVSDKMVVWGIKAIWNFTPLRIRVPENIVVQNTSLYAHLSLMFNRLDGLEEQTGENEKPLK